MDSQTLTGLYAITDPTLTPDLLTAVTQALAGGVRWVQYRNKPADAITRFKECKALAALCHAQGARLIVNDDVVLAKATGADGVHLGQHDGDVKSAREFLGAEAIVGVTCHDSLMLAEKARAAGANYVAFGRFFPSRTKPDAPQADISVLKAARQLGLPVVAIGGITPANGRVLLEAGADVLAVIHGIFGQPDIAAACRELQTLFVGGNARTT